MAKASERVAGGATRGTLVQLGQGGGSFLVAIAAGGCHAVRAFRFDPGDRVVFGREGSDVGLDDTSCSRRHFEVANDEGTCVLRDLGSSNGTFVNDKKITSTRTLYDRDKIRVGSCELIYRVGARAEPAAAPASPPPSSPAQPEIIAEPSQKRHAPSKKRPAEPSQKRPAAPSKKSRPPHATRNVG